MIRDITEDECEAAALELVAVSGIPNGIELRAIGSSDIDSEVRR